MELLSASTIEAFSAEEWNRLFPGEIEDWSYYRATERANLEGFRWLYFGVRVDGRLRAAAPAFVTDYRLDTTLEGTLRRVVGALARIMPGLLRPRMFALGSPVAETCHAGFAADAGFAERRRLFECILDGAETQAAQHSAQLFAVKDAGAALATLWEPTLRARGLRRQPGLATATLRLPYASVDEYLASLGRATRKDLRRKLRARAALRIEWRRDLDGVRESAMRLYRDTLARADMALEELTPDFFDQVLAELGERAACVCYWRGGALVAFNLVLHDGDRLIDKYIGMDYACARELNLYYVSWMENVRYAIERGIGLYQSGQGLPEEKLRLGSALAANDLWYRHRNRFIDGTLRAAEHAFGLHKQTATPIPRPRAASPMVRT